MKLFNMILMVAVSINLAGCFSSKPSESDAKEVVINEFKEYIDSGDVVVESLKKKDGVDMGQGEFKMYDMTVEITLKFPKGIDCQLLPSSYNTTTFPKDLAKCRTLRIEGREPIASGASYTLAGVVRFIKSEAGWKGGLAN